MIFWVENTQVHWMQIGTHIHHKMNAFVSPSAFCFHKFHIRVINIFKNQQHRWTKTTIKLPTECDTRNVLKRIRWVFIFLSFFSWFFLRVYCIFQPCLCINDPNALQSPALLFSHQFHEMCMCVCSVLLWFSALNTIVVASGLLWFYVSSSNCIIYQMHLENFNAPLDDFTQAMKGKQ